MRKILITGGAGFIGSALAEKLISDKDNYVVIVDNLITGHKKKLPELPQNNWRFINCNVNEYRDIAEIMLSYSFDYIFHYAALAGVQKTLQNPMLVLEDIEGIKNILNLSKNTGVKRVFFSSSSEIYGEPVEFPQNEFTTPLNSRLPYAIVKNVGEAFLRSYKKSYDLDFTIFRFFNTFGTKQSRNFVISKFLSRAMCNQDIEVYGDGTQTRTFIYIDDNVSATTKALYDNLVINDVVNIGGEKEINMLTLASLIVKLTGSKSKIVHIAPLEEGDMQRRQPDAGKMKKLLNKSPISLEDGLKKIIKEGLFELQINGENGYD